MYWHKYMIGVFFIKGVVEMNSPPVNIPNIDSYYEFKNREECLKQKYEV